MLDYSGLSAEEVLASGFRERFTNPDGLEKLEEQGRLVLWVPPKSFARSSAK
jgi:hypothetical protein